MAKKEKKCECEPGAPMWVLTYGDMMSLLLTFFILLLSFASMEKPRDFQEAIISIKGAFGVMPQELQMVRIQPAPVRMRRPNEEAESLARRVQRGLQVMGIQQDVKFTYDTAGGIKISLPGEILFPTGGAVLRADAYTMLDNLGALLAELPDASFEVRGHTDSMPMGDNSVYRDNHDLSFARADAVARYLQRTSDIPISQFEIIGSGDGRPVASNTTEEGRQANRRVEVFVRGMLSNQRVRELQNRVEELTNPRQP
jgi:chemotaxis protein MotB